TQKGRASMASSDSAGDVRARAVFGHRASALAARAAVVVLAIYLTLPLLAPEATLGFDATVSATIADALIVAACGVLALLARRNRLLALHLKRDEERLDELADRNRELREAESANRAKHR